MRTRVAMVLLAAFVVEALNFSYLTPALDIGEEPGTPWYIQLMELQWILLHWLGLITSDWFERMAGCHEGNVAGGCGGVDSVVFFVSGFLTTALLLFLVAPIFVHFFGRSEASELI